HCVVVPKAVQFLLMNSACARRFVAQFESKRISAFVSKRRLIFVRIYDSALLIEIFRAYMQWLVNIGDVMRKQNKCYGLGYFSLILFRHSSLQNLYAELNHMDDVPFAATSVPLAVPLRRDDRNVGVVEPMMRRRAGIHGRCRRICSPEIAQLPVDAPMR